jgi:ABC-2 type transport system ATP-binding protein
MIAIDLAGVAKTYPRADAPALAGIDLHVPAGSFLGLLGPNGAGKTTLISILAGILAPDGGTITLQPADGSPALSPQAARARLGLVPQDLAFYPSLSVEENLRFFGAMQGLGGARLREALDAALAVGRLEGVRRQAAATLSGGMRRRLNLAIGVIHRPALLVLDEPTVGVDAQSRHYLQQELRALHARGTTIVYTSHYLEEVEALCDRIAVIDRGRLVAHGALDDLLQDDVVRLRLATRLPARFVEALLALPAVSDLRVDDAAVAIVTGTPAATLAAALDLARDAGMPVVEAAMGTRDLEALFFKLTGTRLRDGEAPPEPSAPAESHDAA